MRQSVVGGALAVAIVVTTLGCNTITLPPKASTPTASQAAGVTDEESAAPLATPDLVGHRYILALISAFRRDPLATHLVQTGKATSSQGSTSVKVSLSMTLDISGRELKAHSAITSGGKTTKTDLVVVGKTAYARAGSSAWRKSPRNGVEKSISDTIKSLRLIDDPADLRYVGPETVDKQALQHLTAARTIPYDVAAGATGQYDAFDVWIKEDGTPVLVRAAYSAKVNGITVKGTTEFRFSTFGGPIKITAPKTK